MSMNPRTCPNAQNQHCSYLVCPFPGTPIPSVLMSSDLQNGVQYVSPGGGVFPNNGLTCSCVLNTLPGLPAAIPSGSGNFVSRQQRPQTACVHQSSILIGRPTGLPASHLPLYQNVPTQRGRASQDNVEWTNQQQQPMANGQPGFASLEMQIQNTPSLQNGSSVQASLPWPTMRVNAEPLVGSTTEGRSSFTSVQELRDFQNQIWPTVVTPRSPSAIDDCLRQSCQQRRRWNIQTHLQGQEEKNRDTGEF